MATPTAILSTIPAELRSTRKAAGMANTQLDRLAQYSSDFTVQLLAQGVLYADATGRTTGTIAMALRKATPWQAAQLLAAMSRDGITLMAEVPAWLNANALSAIA